MTKQYFIDQYVVKRAKTLENLTLAMKAAKRMFNDGELDEELTLEDIKPHIDDDLYNQLCDQFRTPEEIEAWKKIESAAKVANTKEELQNVLDMLPPYKNLYPTRNAAADELKQWLKEKLKKISANEELVEWNALDKTNYYEVQNYKMLHPYSAYYDEMEEIMWELVKTNPCDLLPLYPIDFPDGKNTAIAKKYESFRDDWMEFKKSQGDEADYVLMCKTDYINKVGIDNPFYKEVHAKYKELKNETLASIEKNPGGCSKNVANDLIRNGIFSLSELTGTESVTEESWKFLNNFTGLGLPWSVTSDIPLALSTRSYCINQNSDLSKYQDATDVFFFGVPGTGKSCLLMGLSGLNGKEIVCIDEDGKKDTIVFKFNALGGGEYMMELQCFLNARHAPGPTIGNFVAVIQATIESRRHKTVHRINLVEMAGEDFLYKLSMKQDVAIADMGEGVSNLLNSNNRKVFFFVVDPTKDDIKVDYKRMGKGEGTVFLRQDQILQTFGNLLSASQYASILKKVDAIHIVVTKADTLKRKSIGAKEFLLQHYNNAYSAIDGICGKDKCHEDIGFSIGKLYIGDIFDYNPTESQEVLELIKESTFANKKPSFWDKLKKTLHS